VDDTNRKVGAKCRVCGEQLTVAEFRACRGVGHYCEKHRPASTAGRKTTAVRPSRPRSASSGGGRRNRRISESGTVEFPCKAQFARNGVIRRGRLTSDHVSCPEGGVVFVSDGVGYGPGEIAVLFIRDPDGRRMAEHVGYDCHD